jgi:hypothetical protein
VRSVRYAHRQWSWLPPLGVIGAALAAAGAVADTPSEWAHYGHWIWFAPAIAALICAAFSSLGIAIDRDELRWHFGPGIWRKTLVLTDIVAVDVTRTTFWNGWGIRYTRRGWLYNVAGLDAVMVSMRYGKSVLLGTDEPKGLASAIRVAAGLK